MVEILRRRVRRMIFDPFALQGRAKRVSAALRIHPALLRNQASRVSRNRVTSPYYLAAGGDERSPVNRYSGDARAHRVTGDPKCVFSALRSLSYSR